MKETPDTERPASAMITVQPETSTACPLVAAAFPAEKESDIIVVTREGMAIDFAALDVPVQGRSASGVRAISLAATDSVSGAKPFSETFALDSRFPRKTAV